jgi:hypothetical protein
MFRPPPEWFYKKAVEKYERQFRRKLPQWVQTLSGENVRGLIGVSTRLEWKLPTKILVAGEFQTGPESLWSLNKTRLDSQTENLVMKSLDKTDVQKSSLDTINKVSKVSRKSNLKK